MTWTVIAIVTIAVLALPIFGYLLGYSCGRDKGFEAGVNETVNLYERVYGTFKKGDAE